MNSAWRKQTMAPVIFVVAKFMHEKVMTQNLEGTYSIR
jgi:hypothetical protein